MGLIGIVLAGLVNIFLASSALQFAISVIAVLLFTGLTAFDTQRIKEGYLTGDTSEVTAKKAILGALTLYLDFINLFVMLLQLVGQRSEWRQGAVRASASPRAVQRDPRQRRREPLFSAPFSC